MKKLFMMAAGLLTFLACKQNYTPKQKAYFRIDFPEKTYKVYDSTCPFTFEYPSYAGVFPDSSRNTEPCWLNVRYQPFNAALHITYKNVAGDTALLAALEEQSRKYAYEHAIKASNITPKIIDDTARNMYITTYTLEGETATSFRFFATDDTKNFVDGAFYFNHRTNVDSIAPVREFLMKDLNHMLETMRWK